MHKCLAPFITLFSPLVQDHFPAFPNAAAFWCLNGCCQAIVQCCYGGASQSPCEATAPHCTIQRSSLLFSRLRLSLSGLHSYVTFLSANRRICIRCIPSVYFYILFFFMCDEEIVETVLILPYPEPSGDATAAEHRDLSTSPMRSSFHCIQSIF